MDQLKNKFTVRARAVIVNDGKMLAVRHMESNFFSLPGGTLEAHENIKECLEREMIEELGVKPEIGRLLYINKYSDRQKFPAIDFMFEVKNGGDFLGCENLERTHAHELAEIVWLAPDNRETFYPVELNEDFKNGAVLSGEVRFIV